MRKFKSGILVYWLLMALDFYVLPLLMKDTGSAMLILLAAMPVVCFVVSMLYGVKKESSFLFPVGTAVLFVPTIFIYYNSSVWIYVIVFGVISLAGFGVGKAIGGKSAS